MVKQDVDKAWKHILQAKFKTELNPIVPLDGWSFPENDKKEAQEGIPLGITGVVVGSMKQHSIDSYMAYGGVPRGSLSIIMGLGGEGKSSLLANLAVYHSLSGYNVAYFSLEKHIKYSLSRNISILLNMPTTDIVRSPNKAALIRQVKTILSRYPDRGSLHMFRMRARRTTPEQIYQAIQDLNRRGPRIDVVDLDYLDILQPARSFNEARLEIDHNTVMLKDMADELGFALITPSQKNRGAVGKKDADRSNVAADFSKTMHSDLFLILNSDIDPNSTDNHKRQIKVTIDKNSYGGEKVTFVCNVDLSVGRFFDPFPMVE